MQYSAEKNEISEYLRKNGVKSLYHFTDIRNLPLLIETDALCSKHLLQELGLFDRVFTGGNETSLRLDRRNHNWSYISLNFTAYTPMAHKKKKQEGTQICFLLVDPVVATWAGVVFTNTNATRSGHLRKEGMDGLRLVNFDAIHSLPRPNDAEGWHTPVQAEVLVPGRIPLGFVQKIAFMSPASKDYAVYLCADEIPGKFDVDNSHFCDSGRSSQASFPYVESLYLTDEQVAAENAFSDRKHQALFSRLETERIYAVVHVNSVAATRIRFVWRDPDDEIVKESRTEELADAATYYWSSNIAPNRLAPGIYSVEFLINDIPWTQVKFKIE